MSDKKPAQPTVANTNPVPTVTLKVQTVEMILNYLSKHPYSDVAGLIQTVLTDVQMGAKQPLSREEIQKIQEEKKNQSIKK